ncbi:MAG: RNA methyltransferase [Saprospiraceae bacterium]
MAISKATIQYIKSLQLRKFRQKYNNFIAEGDKIVSEIVRQAPDSILQIYALPEWLQAQASALVFIKDKAQEITSEELKKISGLITPNQVLAIVQQPHFELDADYIKNNLSLYLDNIQDPGNMGTILRIADWFGIRYVLCSPNCVEVFSPKVVQASMGAFLRVKALEINLIDIKNQYSELPIFGAVLHGENVFKASLDQRGILVIGNESKGITSEIESLLTHRIAIPAGPGGGAESLNAAVATGILVAVLRNKEH